MRLGSVYSHPNLPNLALSVEEIIRRGSHTSQVAVVAVGGAGNNLLSQAITNGLSPKNCVAVNTDRRQLSTSVAHNKVLFSEHSEEKRVSDAIRSDGGRALAHRVVPLTRNSEFTILLTGLGGSMGTIAAPQIAELNRNQASPVVSVVALPFIHERSRRLIALRGLKRMIEASNSTVVIDNAVQSNQSLLSKRSADENASLAVNSLSRIAAVASPISKSELLGILSLGQVAQVCLGPSTSDSRIQSIVIDALRFPSAGLPLSMAKGAILISIGPHQLSSGQAALAYEAIVSLVGHDLEFIHFSLDSEEAPRLLIFLSGFHYGTVLRSMVDMIEHLYDLEYGGPPALTRVGLSLGIYQMEDS